MTYWFKQAIFGLFSPIFLSFGPNNIGQKRIHVIQPIQIVILTSPFLHSRSTECSLKPCTTKILEKCLKYIHVLNVYLK